MNLYTLSDAFSACSRFVENGSGACDPDTVTDRVNEACQRLIVKGDWPHCLVSVRIRVDNMYFPLPEEIESIRAVNIDNMSSAVNSPYFRFMDSGPGEERSWAGTGAKFLEELGMFCTMYDIPSIERPSGDTQVSREFTSDGLRIMAFSTSTADANKDVSLQGLDKYNAELGATGSVFTPTETLHIVPWAGAEGSLKAELASLPYSTRAYRQLLSWSKPETHGYVSLYAVEPETSRMWFLAKAHPYSTRPSWRRFAIRGQTCCGSNILILGKLAARKLRSMDDLLPVQNIPAIKMMIQAIEFENKQQLKSAIEFEAQAIRLLSEQKDDHDSQGPTVQVIDHQAELFGAPLSRYISR